MEENKQNVINMNPEITMEDLKKQLMEAREAYARLYKEAQEKINSLNYNNAFQQQQFMLEIVKMKDTFPENMVKKAITAIDNFWFEEPKQEEVHHEQGESK